MSRKLWLLVVGVLFLPLHSNWAQQVLPPVRQEVNPDSPYLASPAEFAFELWAEGHRAEDAAALADSLPRDSIRRHLAGRALQWLTRVQNTPVAGLQLNGAMRVAVIAGRDSVAQAQIAARLADPSVSMHERAYTLLLAVQVFGDTTSPARMAIAERYTAMLDTMPVAQAGLDAYTAHTALAKLFEAMGDTAGVLKHGLRALEMLPKMLFSDRWHWFYYAGERGICFKAEPYTAVAHVLVRTPAGRAKLDSLSKMLVNVAVLPSASDVARDSSAPGRAKWMRESFEPFVKAIELLLQPAPPVKAMAWFNLGDQPRTELPLNDGTVRLVVFGDVSCQRCLVTLRRVNRLRASFPKGVDALYITNTRGAWGILGSRLLDPPEETQLLRRFYRDSMQVTVPIALWVGEKARTDEGGMLPKPSVNLTAFKIPVAPYHVMRQFPILIVDGRGIIQRVFYEFGRAEEAQALAVIASLRRSALQQ